MATEIHNAIVYFTKCYTTCLHTFCFIYMEDENQVQWPQHVRGNCRHAFGMELQLKKMAIFQEKFGVRFFLAIKKHLLASNL